MPDYNQPQPQAGQVQQGYALKPVAITGVPQTVVQGPQEWTQTLCGCTENWEICCDEFWCSYCHIGYMYGYLETGTQKMDPLACCGTCVVDYFIGGIARCLVIMHLRGRLTVRYGIPEDGCETCMLSCCCSSCVMCQMHREMDVRKDYIGGCCYKAPIAPPPMQQSYPVGSYPEQQPQQVQPQYAQPQYTQPVAYQPQYQNAPYAQQQQQPAYETKV